MATTTKITSVLKVNEFQDIYEALISCERWSQHHTRIIELIEKQTFAKQKKFWAFYDLQQLLKESK